MAQQFDVVVIGAGPGGYIAAIRAAQLGFKVAVIEKYKNHSGDHKLGGTCLNVGCIPSKALLESSENYERVLHKFAEHGITVEGTKFDLSAMMKRKDGIIEKMTKGIEFLFRKNKITWFKGHGKFIAGGSPIQLHALLEDGKVEALEASFAIIATGSNARNLSGIPVDNKLICDNIGALSLDAVPKKLGVIGAGVIGLELGSVWKRLGADVTILEAMPTFLAACDESIQKEAIKIFTKEQGLNISLGVKINEVKTTKKGVTVDYTDSAGAAQKLECDRLVVSVGRVPNTDNLGLDNVGIKTNERGYIEVNKHLQTSQPNIFAIGDVVPGPMLAHKAEDEGVMVAEILAGQKPHIDYNCIPWVIYTSPEIAWVGKTEQQLKDAGIPYRAGQFPFMANGRALGQGDSLGFVKILAHAETDEILGAHILNHSASELIAEITVAMEFKASSEDIARICHAHPSLSEVVREAALAVDKRALNM